MPKMKYDGERLVPFDKILNPMRVENLARFKFFCEKIPQGKILDLGCGSGEGTAFLSHHTANLVLGIDQDYASLLLAEEEYSTSGAVYTQMDVLDLALPSGFFDAIISVEVIEHILNVKSYLNEAHRVLKHGGVFMLTTPNRLQTRPPKGKGSTWPAHVREYTPEELVELLTNVFEQVETWGESIPVYEKNFFRKVVHKIAPFVKPYLPHSLRVKTLPTLQYLVKSNLRIEDIQFTNNAVDLCPTLIAFCTK